MAGASTTAAALATRVAFRHAAPATRGLATHASFEPWPHAASPLEEATGPPPSWVTPALALHAAELATVFWGPAAWVPIARAGALARPGDRAAADVAGAPTLAVRDGGGTLRAFHNVCRHQASRLVGGGTTTPSPPPDRIVCPYHGWTYALDGRLTSAPGLGVRWFRAREFGLRPLGVGRGGGDDARPPPPAVWGPFVWARVGGGPDADFDGWLGGRAAREELEDALRLAGEPSPSTTTTTAASSQPSSDLPGFTHVASASFPVRANWKVAVANYLDGGYHVPGAHPALAGGLDMGSYANTLIGRTGVASLQTVRPAAGSGRLGGGHASSPTPAAYAFLYPATMLNRYGPWLDANVVVPTGPGSCVVRYDWWVEEGAAADARRESEDPAAPLSSLFASDLAASAAVQAEDTALCEAVQAGSASPGAVPGRYARREGLLKRFHELVHADLVRAGLCE
jgi:choline monooxygenase